MIEEVVEKRVSYRDCVGWLCHVLASESTTSGQLATLRKQSVDSPSPVCWWLLARLEHSKLQREISGNSQRGWYMLVKLLALMTLSGTPVKSKTPLFVEGTGATGDQQGASVKPGVALRGSMHQPSRTLGAALSAAGYSERRLAALLNAGDRQLEEQLIRACRFLLAKKESFDCRELADLIFVQDSLNEQPDRVRQKIARAYFRTSVKKETDSSQNS